MRWEPLTLFAFSVLEKKTQRSHNEQVTQSSTVNFSKIQILSPCHPFLKGILFYFVAGKRLTAELHPGHVNRVLGLQLLEPAWLGSSPYSAT